MDINYEQIENELYRQDLSQHTIPRILGNVRRLQEKGALSCKESFEKFTTDFFRSGGSRAYYNKFVQALRWYGRAYKLAWVEEFKVLSEPVRVRQAFSDEEIEQFLALPSTLFWKTFWTFWAYIGCRAMEIRTVLTSDLNFQNRSVIFRDTKTHQDREIPISDPVLPLLAEYIPTAGKYLFGISGKVMSDRTYLKDFQKRCAVLGIDGRQPYSFRHSAITRLLENGASFFAVQDYFGHRKAETTRRYYHGSLKAMKNAIKKDPLLKKQRSPQENIKELEDVIQAVVENDSRYNMAKVKEAIAKLWEAIR